MEARIAQPRHLHARRAEGAHQRCPSRRTHAGVPGRDARARPPAGEPDQPVRGLRRPRRPRHAAGRRADRAHRRRRGLARDAVLRRRRAGRPRPRRGRDPPRRPQRPGARRRVGRGRPPLRRGRPRLPWSSRSRRPTPGTGSTPRPARSPAASPADDGPAPVASRAVGDGRGGGSGSPGRRPLRRVAGRGTACLMRRRNAEAAGAGDVVDRRQRHHDADDEEADPAGDDDDDRDQAGDRPRQLEPGLEAGERPAPVGLRGVALDDALERQPADRRARS